MVRTPTKGLAERNLTLGFWALALILFSAQAWATRFSMTWDGIQYLDEADLYFRGAWSSAANSQWSPMYAWVLGAFLHVLHPSAYWEFPAVHLANWTIAIFTLGCFQFYLSGVLRSFRNSAVPGWTIIAVAFPCFLYTTLDFCSLEAVTPDLLMHAFAYLAAGCLVRIQAGERRLASFFALGLILGLGYLAKAPFFFYSLACFVILFGILIRTSARWSGVAVVVAGFLIVAGPFIGFLSHWKHRFTYGDSGRYNIVWMVNGVPYYHWHGKPPGSGTPLHPTRQISTDPPAYEFATPIAGTYPPWYDPIYWNEGAKPHYVIGEFARAVVRELRMYEFLIHHRQLAVVCGLLILFLALPNKREIGRQLLLNWPVLVFALTPFAMYALVHVDSRFLSSFFVLIWTTVLFACAQPARENSARLIRSVAIVVGILMTVESLIVTAPSGSLQHMQSVVTGASRHPYWEMARKLEDLGLRPGDPVAIIGNQLPYFWARLARVHIVSEVLMSEPPCCGTGGERRTAEWESVRNKLAATGAKLVVSPCIHGVVDQPGWTELGDTGVYAYRF